MRTTFGAGLKQWRTARGMSQLELAGAADVSQRHISFLETGRSKPSREMVLHLGHTLDVPPREQNVLLTAAGHAPGFTETALDHLGEIRAAIDSMLEGHRPHMAVVIDRRWNVVAANDATGRFMEWAFPEPPPWMTPPVNLMRLMFHPEGLRVAMSDWDDTAVALLRRLTRDVALYPTDHELAGLLDEIQRYPGVDALEHRGGPADAGDLVLTTTYRIDDAPVSLFTTIAVIGDAHDLTLSELRIETFWPADPASAERWRQRFG